MVATAAQIVGPLSATTTCSVLPGVSAEHLRADLKTAVHTVDTGEGVLVLTDLFGGSPCTQSLNLCGSCRIEVLSGVNLPMLLKANSLRASLPLEKLAKTLAEYGQRNITVASELLKQEPRPLH
ncbi:MAG: PTS sugar transporter subunit IIA [Myxococcaceae bacterium]